MKQWILKTAVALTFLLGAAPGCTKNVTAPEADSFSSRPAVQEFIDEMVTRHDFNTDELQRLFSQVQRRDDIIELMRRPAESMPWYKYRPIFLTRSRIEGGVAFWEQNAGILAKAEREFGVDAALIVAIIGVETRYGSNTGSHRVLDALSTLAFDYPPRSKFFRSELEQYLILAREEDIDLLSTKGSYAGAMGYGQFIPSSYRHYSVDFDGDGKRDLWSSRMDIIGSVANYLHVHGWQLGAPVTERARVKGDGYRPFLELGLKPKTTVEQLKRAGVTSSASLGGDEPAALFALESKDGPKYWLGLNNFYVITRYNRSPLYAMAVYQLSDEIRQARERASQAVYN